MKRLLFVLIVVGLSAPVLAAPLVPGWQLEDVTTVVTCGSTTFPATRSVEPIYITAPACPGCSVSMNRSGTVVLDRFFHTRSFVAPSPGQIPGTFPPPAGASPACQFAMLQLGDVVARSTHLPTGALLMQGAPSPATQTWLPCAIVTVGAVMGSPLYINLRSSVASVPTADWYAYPSPGAPVNGVSYSNSWYERAEGFVFQSQGAICGFVMEGHFAPSN